MRDDIRLRPGCHSWGPGSGLRKCQGCSQSSSGSLFDGDLIHTRPCLRISSGHALRRGALLLPGVVVEHLWSCGAVLSTPYPLSRGGPLSWDIQLEELWEGAERLASGAEARARGGGGADTRGKDGADAPRASGRFPACPDYHFFVSRRGAAHAH